MTIQERLEAAEQRFNELREQRDAMNEEMLKLQGEYRLLQQLEADGTNPDMVNKTEADVIEVVPESNEE